MSISENIHASGLLSFTQGYQEKWIQKSWASFEEECKFISWTIRGRWAKMSTFLAELSKSSWNEVCKRLGVITWIFNMFNAPGNPIWRLVWSVIGSVDTLLWDKKGFHLWKSSVVLLNQIYKLHNRRKIGQIVNYVILSFCGWIRQELGCVM